MKLLFDHNLSPALVTRLQDLYPESQHVYYLELEQATDNKIWDYAQQEQFLMALLHE